MGWFKHDSEEARAHSEVINAHHKTSLSHQLLTGAAAFEAAKAYEAHLERHGRPDSHAKAKELAAGFAASFIDWIVETKGLDFIDRQMAKHRAKEHIIRFLPVPIAID